MNPATVVWWELLDRSTRGITCDFGFEMVVSVEPYGAALDRATYQRLCDGESPVFAERSQPALSGEEFRTEMQAPAAAWMVGPSPGTFGAMAAAAASIADSLRAYPTLDGLDSRTFDVALLALRSYPGSDRIVYNALESLRPALSGLPPIIDNGTYTVGKTIQPGTYRTIGPVSGCYWETLDSAGEINDNNFIQSAPQAKMTVRKTDFAVHIEDCNRWVKIS